MNKFLIYKIIITIFILLFAFFVFDSKQVNAEGDEYIDPNNHSCNESENNNNISGADHFNMGMFAVYNCTIGEDDSDDYFKAELKKGELYKIILGNENDNKKMKTNIKFELIAPNGRVVCSTDDFDTSIFNRGHEYNFYDYQNSSYFYYSASMNGEYYLHFYSNNVTKLKYFFQVYGGMRDDPIWDFYLPRGYAGYVYYTNEWVDGKWYNSKAEQNYGGILEWRCNNIGWWVEDSYGWYPVNQWQKIDGSWYYFDSEGYMASDEWVDGYYVSYSGEQQYSNIGKWYKDHVGWYYEADNGWSISDDWKKIDGYWYFFGIDGYMVTNTYIDGYWIDDNGICH